MEFFEFDNSFIADRHSRHTSLNVNSNDGYDIGGSYKIPCSQVQDYKSGNFTMPTPQQKEGMQRYCIDNMPYQVTSGKDSLPVSGQMTNYATKSGKLKF